MTDVHISIGNSDDKLPQAEWAQYVDDFRRTLRNYAEKIHGEWYSAADSAYQNACIAIEVHPEHLDERRGQLAVLRKNYEQDSIAWLSGTAEFI